MPTIGEMKSGYGFSKQGIEEYLEQIKSIVLIEASEAVRNTSSIESACVANWEGKAREDFIDQLRKSAEFVAEQYSKLYNELLHEIHLIGASYSDFDQNLFRDMN